MQSVLVTGATGFVGGHAAGLLLDRGWRVRRVLRKMKSVSPEEDAVAVGDIGPATDWTEALAGIDCVLHLAAHVHVAHGAESDFHRVNVEGTKLLAEEAARAGVKRFVFVSSIKVNGETTGAKPFTEDDVPAPADAYGRSKRDAEAALWHIAAETGLEVVVVRPPLVHGPGVRGNLHRIMALLVRGIPLPLAAVVNRRSLVGVANLGHLLALCLDHPAAPGETFLASDTRALSTPDLLRLIAQGLHARARLFPMPPAALRLAASLLGRQDDLDKLCLSLEIDAGKARALLGWAPTVSVERGLSEMAQWHVDHARG